MSLLYVPAGRAREYAGLACNIYKGCDTGCLYCYGASVLRMTHESFVASTPRPSFLEKLAHEAENFNGIKRRVLLCFSCDPYQALDEQLGITRETINILHYYDFGVTVLTKGGKRALRDLDIFCVADRFATTLTFMDNESTSHWEPGSASPAERVETIKAFHDAGIRTWVSLEPVFDIATSLAAIEATHEFVDLYKVGKLNHQSYPGHDDKYWRHWALSAASLLGNLRKPYYIKQDLAAIAGTRYASLHLHELDQNDIVDPSTVTNPLQLSTSTEQLSLLL